MSDVISLRHIAGEIPAYDTIMFRDRKDAGLQLARALAKYENQQVVVLGIPRGGVVVAYYVARSLNGLLSMVITKKLGYPENPEAAFGALAEGGKVYLSPGISQFLETDIISRAIAQETKEIQRRVDVLRNGKPLPNLRNKVVIIVDDGIATGSTVIAAIERCRQDAPAKLIVAAPIASPLITEELRGRADDLVILETPPSFEAVGQGYEHFQNLTDEQTVAYIEAWENRSG